MSNHRALIKEIIASVEKAIERKAALLHHYSTARETQSHA
jgi:hypothetical protein